MKQLLSLILLVSSLSSFSQEQINLSTLKDFEVGKNWQIVGGISSNPFIDNHVELTKGTGILLNVPDKKHSSNLLTKAKYGDVDVELEFMMPKTSNSGIYLQGRYEIQLLDSWGKINPNYGDCGGIYKRRRPDQSLYEGHAPLINASTAPGTWQKIYISFQAPRFDEKGSKTQNAKILKVILNGFTIHENIELSGPTGGPISEEEAAEGPIMIQGDHGPVAFRNIKITGYKQAKVDFRNISYDYYEGEVPKLLYFDYKGLTPTSGKTDGVDLSMAKKDNGWSVVFKGKLEIPESGKYVLGIQAGGSSQLFIDGKQLMDYGWARGNWPARESDWIELEMGSHDVELHYSKVDGWQTAGLGFFIRGKNIRRTALHTGITPPETESTESPVYLDAKEVRVIRSFMGYPNSEGKEEVLTRVVNTGTPLKLHYSINLENGALLKLWRGEFLDMSEMWNGRGNARANTRGVELLFGNESEVNLEFESKGYTIDSDGYPVFKFANGSNSYSQKITIEEGKVINRTINPSFEKEAQFQLVKANNINKISEDLYTINDCQYFIKVTSGVINLIQKDGYQVLVTPLKSTSFTYSIIW